MFVELEGTSRGRTPGAAPAELAVSIVMPCLDEAISLPHCIANAAEALARIEATYGLAGEIVVADNGSTDGSQALATALGARVVTVVERGYGAALIGGARGAFGRFILMGDADGSYDFIDGVPMIGALLDGMDLCMGSRFQGGIEPGAMPWKNRWIGNPALTFLLNLLYRSGIDDAHCGLRAIRSEAFDALGLSGAGMEFASEMVVKGCLLGLRIGQVPATLSRDLRDRPPHLRPWRDGWRHLRYLFMLSPVSVFGLPAAAAMTTAMLIFAIALLHFAGVLSGAGRFGTSWTIVAGFLFTSGLSAAIMALAAQLHGIREGYRRRSRLFARHAARLTLETMLVTGAGMIATSLIGLASVGIWWSRESFHALPSTLPLVLAATIGAAGLQLIFGGFLVAIVAGNRATFLEIDQRTRQPARTASAIRAELGGLAGAGTP